MGTGSLVWITIVAAVYLAGGITAFRVPERVTTACARHLLTSNGSTHMTLRAFTSVGLERIAAATAALDPSTGHEWKAFHPGDTRIPGRDVQPGWGAPPGPKGAWQRVRGPCQAPPGSASQAFLPPPVMPRSE